MTFAKTIEMTKRKNLFSTNGAYLNKLTAFSRIGIGCLMAVSVAPNGSSDRENEIQ